MVQSEREFPVRSQYGDDPARSIRIISLKVIDCIFLVLCLKNKVADSVFFILVIIRIEPNFGIK